MPRRDPDTTAAACFDVDCAMRRALNLAVGGAVRRWSRSRAELIRSAHLDLLDAQTQLNTLISIIERCCPPPRRAHEPPTLPSR